MDCLDRRRRPRVGGAASLVLLIFGVSLWSPAASWAQVEAPPVLAPILLPLPPEVSSREGGDVSVRVSFGADGVVVAAAALDGPLDLRSAATVAAWSLRLGPHLLRGRSHPVDAVVIVRFAAASPTLPARRGSAASLGSTPDRPNETMVVLGTRVGLEDAKARTTVSQETMDRAAGQDLARAVASVAGVQAARGTADTSKPVIRGQQERRLLLMFDGVGHAGQKWGSDHAPEIDAMAASDVQVVKGAAGVRYGPDAIGGVVLVEPRPLRTEPGADGRLRLVAITNGPRFVGGARVDAAFAALPGFAVRVEGNYARGAALRAPTYVLGNTASQQWNLGVTAGLTRRGGGVRLAYRHYDLRAGVCFCVRSSTPADFLSQLDAETPVGAERWTSAWVMERPRQRVTHELVTLRAHLDLRRAGTLRVDYSLQANHRREYEQVRASVTGPQYDFTLRTQDLRLRFVQAPLHLPGGLALDGEAGIAGSEQDNVYAGLPLIPNHRGWGVGVFGIERLSGPGGLVEVGARYDHGRRASFMTPEAFARHLGRGTLTESDCTELDAARRCPAAWNAGSLSLGLLGRAFGERLEVRLDLSSASRFPNGDELYMSGSAPTLPVYALGDPGLGPETTWSVSPTLGLRLPWLEAEASFFVNFVNDFIYFAPDLDEDGAPRFDVTVRGAYPRFLYRPVDALFHGWEVSATLGPAWPVSVGVRGAVVRAVEVQTGRGLASIPPDRLRANARARLPPWGPFRAAYAEGSAEYVLEQTHVAASDDLAPAPPAFTLIGLALGTDLHLHGRTLTLAMEIEDLLNRPHRDSMSLLRYYADDPGRSLRFRVDFDF